MKLYNKGGRAIIIAREEAIDGCRFPTDVVGTAKAYIDPQTTVEIIDSKAEKLLKMYPSMLMQVDKQQAVASKAKKSKAKKSKKR